MFRKRNCFAYMCIQYYELLNSFSCEGTLDAPGSQRLRRLSLLSPVAVLCFCLNIMSLFGWMWGISTWCHEWTLVAPWFSTASQAQPFESSHCFPSNLSSGLCGGDVQCPILLAWLWGNSSWCCPWVLHAPQFSTGSQAQSFGSGHCFPTNLKSLVCLL